MWNAIFAIFSTLFSFGAGSAGLTPNIKLLPKVPVQTFSRVACYNPQPEVKLTLTWPDDFSNVPDRRPQLNPSVWGDKGLSSFNTDNSCLTIAMNGRTQRTYIRVRQETRIPSCKVDELAGPYASGTCPGWSNNAPELTHRGTCSLDGYTDLRKIAEKKDSQGNPLEIFWNPFSYNVGCNYEKDDNCGPGQRRNINLKDFIYVLKKRDAFDPGRPQDSRPGCPARWDAGATNEEACSHFFDVYMAEDFYRETKSAPATNDPESPYYFVKQVLENCQEDTTFIPAPEANLTIPPIFIKTPFVAQNQGTSNSFDKIIPSAASEKTNYLTYIWGRPDLVVPMKTNLLLTSNPDNKKALNICKGGSFKTSMKTLAAEKITPPTIVPLADCHDPLGNIYFKDDKGATVNFKVFSKPTTPQTFYLLNSSDEKKTYVYTVTEKDYPTNTQNDPSLQLRVMRMISKNAWTWATPWCKPAIYMYPDKPTLVNVKLDLDGQLTVSRPVYNSQSGWSVVAYPDGTLKEPVTLNDHPYLYYEADLTGVTLPKEGFVFSREDLSKSLKSLMETIGFNEKETSDFLSYWLPKLTEKPYYFVTLLPENVINDKEKLNFSVNPDTLIRTRFVFEGLDAPISVKPLSNINSHDRSGFTVTDWGGTIVGKSCSDVTVK